MISVILWFSLLRVPGERFLPATGMERRPPVPCSCEHRSNRGDIDGRSHDGSRDVRKWAEGKGGKPAAVERTHKGGDVGIIRIMFPDAPQSKHDALTEITWEEFFEEFEKRELALLYEEDSRFSKIVGRDTAERREHGDHGAAR